MQRTHGHDDPRPERERIAAERAVASLLGKRGRVGVHDTADIVQMVLERWVTKRGNFDRSGSATPVSYIWAIARNLIADLRDEAATRKRGRDYTTVSLERPLVADADVTLAELVPDPQGEEPSGDAIDRALLRRSVARLHSRLDPRQRNYVDALAAEGTVTGAARLLGLPPSTLHDRLMAIRRLAEDAGLHQYLD